MVAIAALAPSSGGAWLADAWAALRPPTRLTLSQWADSHFRLSGGSADAGKWRTRPYQRGILDAISDPAVERVSVIKSARVGWTQMLNATLAYHMIEDPCPLLLVQPTVETAEIYSREMVAPMLRDVPALSEIARGPSVKTSARTLLHKTFPGGVLSMVGANSGAGFAMISRRVVAFDEVDRYPPSAGDEGDPIALGEKRAETYWNRKILEGSTPLVDGTSRIQELFEAGDQRRFYVPCPQCGHMDFLAFHRTAERGHRMKWDAGQPETACFECGSGNGCVIEETHKRDMLEAGEWRADAPGARTPSGRVHASFHVWAAYSTSPGATWSAIAAEFLAAKGKTEQLRTFVNTTLGETWKDRGEAPDWERIKARAEPYKIGTVPDGAVVVTAGVDVQKDRLIYELVGWAPDRESWSVDAGEFHGNTSLAAGEVDSPWNELDALLDRSLPASAGEMSIAMLAIDSGYNAQAVYAWARCKPMTRVIAIKGVGGARALVGKPSPVDVTVRGRRIQRGYRIWPVGVDIAKSELYGFLRLELGAAGAPPGYCHFPEYGDEFFRQLTAEHLVTTVNKRTHRAKLEWQVLPNRENHHLDARVYARVAAAVLGIDRMAPAAAVARPAPAAATIDVGAPGPASPARTAGRGGFWDRGPRGGGLGRRRR